jgi:small subunit ribosomal protein S1
MLSIRKDSMAEKDWRDTLRNDEEDSASSGVPDTGEDDDDTGEDFAALLETSFQGLKEFSRGEKVRGRVIGVNDEWIFLDLGAKGEGIVTATELKGGAEERSVVIGDWLDAYFLGDEDGEIRLTTRITGADASRNLLEEAFEAKIPVEGSVQKEIKGGFEVLVGGNRCFCPYSQMDLFRQDAATYVGQTLSFLIADFQEGGRNIVLSRRQLLEAERRQRYEELRATLEVGTRVTGVVRAIEAFGAFVDLGGVDALIPNAELSWGRGADPREVVTLGQKVEAQVVELDWDRKRIALSLKRLTPDPWSHIHELLREEQVMIGRVATLAQYGAFVEILPGIDGLLHVSRLSLGKRINHPREVLKEGDQISVRIDSIDAEQRRLTLSLETSGEQETPSQGSTRPETSISVGSVVTARVEAVKLFGVLARLPDGRIGLIPVAELLMSQKAALRRHYKQDQPITVQILEITEGGKRLRLSERAAKEAGEASQVAEYLTESRGSKHAGLGTLGDLLKKSGK